MTSVIRPEGRVRRYVCDSRDVQCLASDVGRTPRARFGSGPQHVDAVRLQGSFTSASPRGVRPQAFIPAISQNAAEIKAIQDGKADKPEARVYLDDLVRTSQTLKARTEALDDVPKMLAVVDGADEHVPTTQAGTPRMVVHEVQVHGRTLSVVAEYGHLQ